MEIFRKAGWCWTGGTLYGTTYGGGLHANGTIFKINTNGTGYTTLHWFTNSPDGSAPLGEMVLTNGTLFGTTFYGGTGNKGTLFLVSTNGGGYTVMHNFAAAPDGNFPYSGLLLNSGTIYGTTYGGGSNYNGTVFAFNPSSNGYRVLYSFSPSTSNADGSVPKGTLAFNNGYLYGTAGAGGPGGGGTLFQISASGAGFAVLRSFTNDAVTGYDLESGVRRAGSGLWGTSYQGGTNDFGTVFNLPLPVITAQPQSVSVNSGNPVAFSVAAVDDSPVTYQWYFNTNQLLPGQTNRTLAFTAGTTNAGAYSVVVADQGNAVTSTIANLSVSSTTPVIITQPADQIQPIGNRARFSVNATGAPPLAYQWYFKSGILNGATNPGLTLGPLLTNQAGGYQVVVTNAAGSATSRQAQLTVLLQPNEYGISNGGRIYTLWLASVPGSTNRLWATTNLALPFGQWRLIATNVAGSNGLFQFADTNSGNKAKFYRLSLP